MNPQEEEKKQTKKQANRSRSAHKNSRSNNNSNINNTIAQGKNVKQNNNNRDSRTRMRGDPIRLLHRNSTPTDSNGKYHYLKRSGEKGAEAHTVPESTRIRFTQMLLSMREDPSVDQLCLPPDLSNTERKFLHLLASQLGLKSKSTGKGDQRRIVITKINSATGMAGSSSGHGSHGVMDDSKLPILDIPGTCIMEANNSMLKYLEKYPPSSVELAEAEETGSSLLKLGMDDAEQNGDGDGCAGAVLDADLDMWNAWDMEEDVSTGNFKMGESMDRKHDEEKREAIYHATQQAKEQSPHYRERMQVRMKLPAYSHQEEICSMIQSKRVTLLSGDTGCGKSTQVPQFILDSDPRCKIVVTQPRRISAISIAERVAWERCEQVGGVVGYNVRLENAMSSKTQLLFVTPGVLLRKLQSSPDLLEFTHVMIDEIHERDKYTEFLMIVLRELMSRRRDLRMVLMSATIQTHELRNYWNGVGAVAQGSRSSSSSDSDNVDEFAPAEICIPGRTFPVQSFYLEDVLSMTGYVNDMRLDGELQQVEEALSNLLASKASTATNDSKFKDEKGRRKRNTKGGVDPSKTVIVSEHSFVCIMCNQGGFKCAEELGSHMGICNGVGNMDMVSLEEKVRNTRVCTEYVTNVDNNVDFVDDYDESEIIFEDDDGVDEGKLVQDDDDDDDDDERLGIHAGKWDGESPFAVADVVESSLKTTLTEEEMLNRYHLMHDDEQVDSDLILETIKYINKASYLDGAILVFLPGWQEISEMTLLLESTPPFGDKTKFSVLPLHSGIPSKDQKLVFQRPKYGVRKIVLSTNIAETSVTIDDIAFVIDSGRAKEKNYDPHLKTSTLQPMWISKASAKQRRGRAGRTKPGVCFHLFSRRRFDSFREFLESELLRTSLEEICLQCKKLNLTPGGPEDDDGIPAFLSAALTPPHPKSVTNALERLVEIGAMEVDTNDLTRLGHCLSGLSVSPEVGKMIIWSYILGCSQSASSMAVAMSHKSPFIIPPPHMISNADKARVEISEGSESDQVTILKVLQVRDNFVKRNRMNQFYSYCRNKFINVATIQMISDLRKNISRELSALGFPDPSQLHNWYNRNETSANLPFLQAAIVAGVYPNVACRQPGATNFFTNTKKSLKIHIGSINACKGQPLSKKSSTLEYIAFGEMVKGKSMYTLNQTTHLSSVIPIMLLCGNFRIRPSSIVPEEVGGPSQSVLSVDDWICFRCNKDFATGLAILRKRLDSIFHRFVTNPKNWFVNLDDREKEILNLLNSVLRSTSQPSR